MHRTKRARLVVLGCLLLTASVWPSEDLFAGSTVPQIAGDLYMLEPCRVYDSRSGAGLRNGTEILVPFFGICGVPTTARAVAFNMTVIGPGFGSGAGNLTMYPANFTNPGVSTIYFDFLRSRYWCNNTVIPLSTNGTGLLRVKAAMTTGDPITHLVIDINGYFE